MILLKPWAVFVWLFCIGLDLAMAVIVVRLLFLWQRTGWSEWLYEVGRNLVDAFTAKVNRFWCSVSHKRLSDQGELLVGLMVLLVTRILLGALVTLL